MDDAGSRAPLALDQAALDRVFPFHLALDRCLRLARAGPVLRRLLPALAPGDPFARHFDVRRPTIAAEFDAFAGNEQAIFLLTARDRPALTLRGQMTRLPEAETVLFLGSPLLSHLDAMVELGLTVHDFALHDPAADFLILLQTQRRALEEAQSLSLDLREARDAAMKASRAKSEFLANMSHELRTPLNAIIGFSELMSKELLGPIPPQYRSYLDDVHMSGVHLLDLIDDLLDISLDLREARDAAMKASRAKSEFLANMSHELRTPLNAIIGFSELMSKELLGPMPPQYRSYLDDVHMSGVHLLDLIDDLLDISRIEAGRYELEERPVALAELIAECLRVVTPAAQKKALRLDVANESFPVVRADPRALKQVLLNVLSNGVKFNREAGRLEVSLRRAREGGVECVVADTGIGIAPEIIPALFQPFRQADSRIARRYGGTGLGLSICKSLIEMHGGTATLTSEVGVGTTVTLRLPANRIIESAAA